jgi:hypothetical protein
MALSITQLFTPVQLPAAVNVLYTVPATLPATAVIKNMRVRLTNTSASPVAVTLYADASANASSAANECLPAVSIANAGYLDVDIPTLKYGDTLRGFAGTANVVTMHEIGGVVYS